MEKYDDKYEHQINELAENRISAKNYKIFDRDARAMKRQRFPELVKENVTSTDSCLIIINREGETLVLTREFEMMLYTALKNSFES